ncbi:MAG: hypothetical protein HRU19_14275 [Pseudobacteriovorax sp.]|nr:hypothetical protein [Pseudobacteriovorax sp.]
MNWKELLSKGDRKEVANGRLAAKHLLADMSSSADLFDCMLQHRQSSSVVSHGFYALKEASSNSEAIRRLSLEFGLRHLTCFEQWEARENFIRIALIKIDFDSDLYEMIAAMANDKSSIVQAYAAEYLIRYNHQYFPGGLLDFIQKFDRLDMKAAGRARVRKIKRSVGL